MRRHTQYRSKNCLNIILYKLADEQIRLTNFAGVIDIILLSLSNLTQGMSHFTRHKHHSNNLKLFKFAKSYLPEIEKNPERIPIATSLLYTLIVRFSVLTETSIVCVEVEIWLVDGIVVVFTEVVVVVVTDVFVSGLTSVGS